MKKTDEYLISQIFSKLPRTSHSLISYWVIKTMYTEVYTWFAYLFYICLTIMTLLVKRDGLTEDQDARRELLVSVLIEV